MRNDLKLVFALLVETPDAPTRRTIAETLIDIIDARTIETTDLTTAIAPPAQTFSSTDAPNPKPRKRMSAAARKAISVRMKRYHREQRAKGKG